MADKQTAREPIKEYAEPRIHIPATPGRLARAMLKGGAKPQPETKPDQDKTEDDS